jgi:hypothetical protein
MEIDKTLFRPEAAEPFEHELLDRARLVLDTDRTEALGYLFELVGGYAEHLSAGMTGAGFPEDEAKSQGWQIAWSKLRRLLDAETGHTREVAAYLERNIGVINPNSIISDAGEPLDPATRTFYRTFMDAVDHPAVHQTAAWLYEDI